MPLSLTEALEQATTSAAAAPGLSDATAWATAARADLEALAEQSVDADLVGLVTQQEPGPVPLLGTGNTAAPYPALLWNGERFERLGVPWHTRLAFVAVTAASPARLSQEDLAGALQAGVAMRTLWPSPPPPTAVAGLTTDTVSAAVCAAAATGHSGAQLAAVAELAAGLMLVSPTPSDPELHGVQAGHSLAAGWLAVQLHLCGVLAAPGTAEEVLSMREAP
jgi:hypothetical protein